MNLRTRLWPGLSTRSIWFEVVPALIASVTVAVDALIAEPGQVVPDAVLIAAGVLQAVALLLFRRRAPLIPFLVSAVLAVLSPVPTVGLLLTGYAVGRYVAGWPLRIAAGLVGALAVVQPWTTGSATELSSALGGVGLVIVLPGALGIWQRTRASLLEALRERAERAESERELLAREAVLTERARIAREMHDAVGHRVSLMVLQAGAIEMAASNSQRVEQLAGQVQAAGRQALEELRQMVGVLRAEEVDEAAPLGPQPGLSDLPRLVEQSRDAGMRVRLSGAADRAVDPVVGRAAYRVVQEALTNAGKHAPGAPVTVTVDRTEEALEIRVINGPSGRPSLDPPSGGFGLMGLAERVRTLDGKLTAGPRLDGGFAVEAVLPT
jgi:signal transduction histidine kinase